MKDQDNLIPTLVWEIAEYSPAKGGWNTDWVRGYVTLSHSEGYCSLSWSGLPSNIYPHMYRMMYRIIKQYYDIKDFKEKLKKKQK